MDLCGSKIETYQSWFHDSHLQIAIEATALEKQPVSCIVDQSV